MWSWAEFVKAILFKNQGGDGVGFSSGFKGKCSLNIQFGVRNPKNFKMGGGWIWGLSWNTSDWVPQCTDIWSGAAENIGIGG